MTSLYSEIPERLPVELCQTLLATPNIRIERIVSCGHRTPQDAWYDQPQTEWVLLVQGAARLTFANAESVEMQAGDYLTIPAHCKHRVDWTSETGETIWLAVHVFETPH